MSKTDIRATSLVVYESTRLRCSGVVSPHQEHPGTDFIEYYSRVFRDASVALNIVILISKRARGAGSM